MATGANADDYLKLQKALKDPSLDRKIARVYRRRLRDAAGPLGRKVLMRGADEMPHRGGLSAYLLGHSPVSVSTRSKGVDVWLGSKKKSQLSLLNRGFLRHPVWARGDRTRKQWGWATQEVPPAAFSRALQDLAPEAARHLSSTITDILKELDLP
jgi:hypothetical protein